MGFTGFYLVLMGFDGFYWILLGNTGCNWVLPNFTYIYLVLMGFTGFYLVFYLVPPHWFLRVVIFFLRNELQFRPMS